MLELKSIRKEYITGTGNPKVIALKGADLSFRNSEFVAILGPSGCGKTTMLNIVGGLDRYTSGDLVINGRSTKDFKPYDWDAYRNNHVGFVFQSYNLIPHQTVLGNVELALTLTGVSKAERKRRAIEALEKVGLKDQIHKRPNQLSGGQMQRVAIARAIVNNPSIILADEPTGALDSKTSVQVMEILKEIAGDRLIIMVTHNDDIAAKYATRTVKLLDGEVMSDTNPYTPTNSERNKALADQGIDVAALEESESTESATPVKQENQKSTADQKSLAKAQKVREKQRLRERRKALRKTSMGFKTALSLSGRNLLTKKGRTFMISLAGSIGIIGIALVLAIQNGFTGYIVKMQADMLSNVPIRIEQQFMDIGALLNSGGPEREQVEEFPEGDDINIYVPKEVMPYHFNYITKEYVDHVLSFDSAKTIDIIKNYNIEPNLVRLDGNAVRKIETSLALKDPQENGTAVQGRAVWQEMIKNAEFLNSQYDVLEGKVPVYDANAEFKEVALVVDNSNRITNRTITELGFGNISNGAYKFSDFIDTEYMLFSNDSYYQKQENGTFKVASDAELKALFTTPGAKDLKVKIVGIMRVKPDSPMTLYSEGLIYPQDLTQAIIAQNTESEIVKAQIAENEKGFLGKFLTPNTRNHNSDFASTIASSFASSLQTEDGGGMTSSQLAMFLRMVNRYIDDEAEFIELFKASSPNATEKEAKDIRNSLLIYLHHEKANAINICAGSDVPTALTIYPLDFATKDELTAHLDAYNADKDDAYKIRYSDTLAILGSTMNDLVNIISYVLIAFAAISLVVSSIMIAIITYVSVIERTKEIGVLRSIGARKKDITRVFNAETCLIGFIAGLLGVIVSYLLTIPINLIIRMAIKNSNGFNLTTNLANLSPVAALMLIVISVVLTLISGLIPAFIAAKKDPVVALRTE